MGIKIRNWNKFQHYGDSRRPIWIKLYRELLDDVNWHELEPLAAKCLVMMWLIASENDGNLPDTKALAFRLRISERDLKALLPQLNNFVEQDASNLLAESYQDASLYKEKEREIELEENRTLDMPKKVRSPALAAFEAFWKVYPKRVGKGRAQSAWNKAIREASPDVIVEAVRQAQWDANPKFIPHPATWLNDKRWLDEKPPPRLTLADKIALKALETEREEQERKTQNALPFWKI